jgi:RNA recognition motif-containing protein
VEFKSKVAADTAIKSLNKSKFNGRTISVQSYDEELSLQKKEESNQPPLPVISTKLFIRNLNFDVTSENLEKLMRQAGRIVSCEVLKTKQGKSLGCGSVEFQTLAESNNAMQLFQNHTFHGRTIQLRDDHLEILGLSYLPSSSSSSEDHHPHSADASSFVPLEYQNNSVFVGNLSDFTSRDDLRQHMSAVGEVFKSTILRGANDVSKNCGLVIYKNQESVMKAIQLLNDTSLDNHLIFVREDRETRNKQKEIPRDSNGQVRTSRLRNSSIKSTIKPERSVYLSNLPFHVTNDQLRELMETAVATVGEVNRVMIYEKGGESIGMGVIEFCSQESVKKACQEFHGKKFFDRKLLMKPYSMEKKMKATGGGGGGGGGRRTVRTAATEGVGVGERRAGATEGVGGSRAGGREGTSVGATATEEGAGGRAVATGDRRRKVERLFNSF